MHSLIKTIYCTHSDYKKEEWQYIKELKFNSKKIVDYFEVEFRPIETEEPLERDIESMVRVKAVSAYRKALVPCIVEHAGLILNGCEEHSFPGGLTQPMWNALGAEQFVQTCKITSLKATARAAIGYCDGSAIHTFVGDTKGTLSETPKGKREFYWDTIFCPEDGGGLTYAEIVKEDNSGLAKKIGLSQSRKAFEKYFAFRFENSPPLFP